MACKKHQKVREEVDPSENNIKEDAPDGVVGSGSDDDDDNWVEFSENSGIVASKTVCMANCVLENLLKLRMDAVKEKWMFYKLEESSDTVLMDCGNFSSCSLPGVHQVNVLIVHFSLQNILSFFLSWSSFSPVSVHSWSIFSLNPLSVYSQPSLSHFILMVDA